VLGFSRGAQLAHRFAEAYPDRTRAAVVMSAGSYTVPSRLDAQGQPLPFPFGMADLEARSGHPFEAKALGAVLFWVAVGGKDNNPRDVPRQWDALVGTNRVERAGSFVRLLEAAGVPASLHVYPNAGHEVSGEMLRGALEFLREATAPAQTAPALVATASPAPAPIAPASPATPGVDAPSAVRSPAIRPPALRRLTPLPI
jgi:pimeloyl-ACP methyl ester carboxylesterase